MTDWDAAIDDTDAPGLANRAFFGLIVAIAWLLCWPLDLVARLRSEPFDEPFGDIPNLDGINIHNDNAGAAK